MFEIPDLADLAETMAHICLEVRTNAKKKILFNHNRALKWKKFRDIALCFNDLLIHMENFFRVRFFFQIDVFAFF